MKFAVKGGIHHEGGKQYTKGQVFESDLPLDELFINKFIRVGNRKVSDDFEVEDDSPPEPIDVTQKFKKAIENGVTVIRNSDETFSVFDGETKLDETPFTTAKDVTKFLKTL